MEVDIRNIPSLKMLEMCGFSRNKCGSGGTDGCGAIIGRHILILPAVNLKSRIVISRDIISYALGNTNGKIKIASDSLRSWRSQSATSMLKMQFSERFEFSNAGEEGTQQNVLKDIIQLCMKRIL